MRNKPNLQRTSRNRASRRGLVLVAAVGVLGVLSVMGMAFATVMRFEARAARNFTESVRADFAARAGIEDAIARLRSMARDGTEVPYIEGKVAPWYTWRGTAGGGYRISFPTNEANNAYDDDADGMIDLADFDELETNELSYTDWVASSHTDAGDTYTLRVTDAASKINVNAGDNLGTMLDNLCRVIGPPLRPADQRALIPKWLTSDAKYRQYGSGLNSGDVVTKNDLFYDLDANRPRVDADGRAVYGDGYAIAGYRARQGAFLSVEDVRNALTYIESGIDGDGDGDPDGPEPDTQMEIMEIEAKFAALRPYITVDSWVDTDQIGYGKFEHAYNEGTNMNPRITKLIDRNRTWNVRKDETGLESGELKGCYVAIVNGVGQGQLKTIENNGLDWIELSSSGGDDSAMRIPPMRDSSYIIIGKDHNYNASASVALNTLLLYAKQPLSFHRAPVNVNTATDKVLTALILGLQTDWGAAGYSARTDRLGVPSEMVAHWHSLCPSRISAGRDTNNILMNFALPCPNDNRFARKFRDDNLELHGHPNGGAPFCFFCNFGRPLDEDSQPGRVGEAHYIAWQILKEREQTAQQDTRTSKPNGWGPFKGWDDLYFRVFRPWERASWDELSLPKGIKVLDWAPNNNYTATCLASGATQGQGHMGLARLCMANFNANTDILKFQPGIEWINRWGANFTDLYIPWPLKNTGNQQGSGMLTKDVKLRIRPGELLDKTDLNVGTTEFSFDSGGVYEIESIGRVYDDVGVVAEKKYSALIRVYDVWRESTQREFVAGAIERAKGIAGSQMAGQVAVDQVSSTKPGGGRSSIRKSLCTYPEPIVPGDHLRPDKQVSALAIGGRTASSVKPAAYDGQLLLATNQMMTNTETAAGDGNVTFYNSFVGDTIADYSRGRPEPILMGLNQAKDPNLYYSEAPKRLRDEYLPADETGLLGAADSPLTDLPYSYNTATGQYEGEGKGGDLRPDGLYLGVTQHDPPPLDGAFEYERNGNIEYREGTICMWVKPNWHQGTYMKSTLPGDYVNNSPFERGSNVTIKTYTNWKSNLQQWSAGQRGTQGFVRERFEHEFFNGAVANAIGRNWNYAHGFQYRKNGDMRNTTGDGDMPEAGPRGTSPFGALHFYFENRSDQDFCAWLPGWFVPMSSEGYEPFYQMCPFRWFFLGITWNYDVKHRATFNGGSHGPYGQIREDGPGGDKNLRNGGQYADYPRNGHTHDKHLSLVLQGRPFIDTMRYWDKRISGMSAHLPSADQALPDADLAGWALAQYGTTYQWGSFPFGSPAPYEYFGLNRSAPPGAHYYQRMASGTYATIDEYFISSRWHDARDISDIRPGGRKPDGMRRPEAMRSQLGRYYFAKSRADRPFFTSQTLYQSESTQSYKFNIDEQDETIELGSVRWYSFTPYYSLHVPNYADYEFPYNYYFLEAKTSTGTQTRVTQSIRHGPKDWNQGPESRNSSQRGCTVSIISGGSSAPTNQWTEYTDPEDWSAILAAGSKGGRHARSTPGQLKYKVLFGFSDEEYQAARSNKAICIDSPVFDDITITYMRRPQVLVWREVSE